MDQEGYFWIVGAFRRSGEDISFWVKAKDKESAIHEANHFRGVLVETCRTLEEGPSYQMLPPELIGKRREQGSPVQPSEQSGGMKPIMMLWMIISAFVGGYSGWCMFWENPFIQASDVSKLGLVFICMVGGVLFLMLLPIWWWFIFTGPAPRDPPLNVRIIDDERKL